MKVAVTSQNFKSITGHAGKSRRFLIFDVTVPCDPEEVGRLDLPMEMSFHEFAGGPHPLDDMDVILTASAGQGFINKLAQRGVKVVISGEKTPRTAVRDLFMGLVKPAAPHVHEHELDILQAKGHSCCSGHAQKC
ncbi:nitrogen fixation [Sulfurimicrobium lacus]|uniref:Nitrogen fixation n=1 Tax=Sulfurimicrobium lacus TaxID=2715678 RepID=A0A6F8VDN2_9PROT|nr:NifB/NifX family molybdenum-iron cluster-binding protein [Sulfurimicrobium lacus]BCB27126.1 nitrogen fixation [Sulfurimicrobium lacus]